MPEKINRVVTDAACALILHSLSNADAADRIVDIGALNSDIRFWI
jgi:hypothetical protein